MQSEQYVANNSNPIQSNPQPMMMNNSPPIANGVTFNPNVDTANGIQTEDKKRLMMDRASKRITAIEDSVIQKYDVLQGHKHPKLFVRLSFIMVLLSIVCFCIWILTTPTGYPWFIHVVYVSALIIGALMIQGSPSYSDRIFSFHTLFFISTSFQLIVMNEHTPSSFPWSVYPIAFLLLCFSIHGMVVKFRQFLNHFYIHSLFYVVINFIVFVTYCYTVHDFPWFLIVIGAWSVFLLAHFAIWKAITFKFNKQNGGAQDTPKATPSNVTGNPSVMVQPTQTVIPPQFNTPVMPSVRGNVYPSVAQNVPQGGFTGEIDPSFTAGLDENFDENQFFDDEDDISGNNKKKGSYEQV